MKGNILSNSSLNQFFEGHEKGWRESSHEPTSAPIKFLLFRVTLNYGKVKKE